MTRKRIAKFRQKFEVLKGDPVFESVSNEIFKYREYRAADPFIISAKKLIVDVGAHLGLFTLYCRLLNNRVKIIALEPEQNNFKLLKENLKKNNISRVKVFDYALSVRSGTGKLQISDDSHNNKLILNDSVEYKNEFDKVARVKTITLTDLLKQNNESVVDVLKMDIEGAENYIIPTWPAEVFSKVRSIIFEYHDYKKDDHKMLELILRERGFGVQIFKSKFDKAMGFILGTNKKLRRNNYGK